MDIDIDIEEVNDMDIDIDIEEVNDMDIDIDIEEVNNRWRGGIGVKDKRRSKSEVSGRKEE